MADPADLSEASKELYRECLQVARSDKDGFRKVFHQDELQSLLDIDTAGLLSVIHELSENALFISLKQQGKVCWATRPRDAANQVRALNHEERMVYQVIEEAHKEGVWVKKIKQKLGILDNTVDKTLNKFLGQNLIKSIRNVKAPMQKTYMLFHLAPSDEVTGGSFYDAGDLDESLVDELGNVIVLHVRSLSWVDVKKKHFLKRDPIPDAVIDLEEEDDDDPASEAVDSRGRSRKRKRESTDQTKLKDPHKQKAQKQLPPPLDLEPDAASIQVAYPATHRYPTAEQIRDYIDEVGLMRTVGAHNLTVEEVQQIINVLVWDEKLEEVNGGYRTVRGVKERPQNGWPEGLLERLDLERRSGNGLTQAPCGRCPVVDLCAPGGPVSAENCELFGKWLEAF